MLTRFVVSSSFVYFADDIILYLQSFLLYIYILLVCLFWFFDGQICLFNLSPTHRQLNCCQFHSSLSLQGRYHLKGECESADGCPCIPCIDRHLDLKLIITMTDTCKWMVILQMFRAWMTVWHVTCSHKAFSRFVAILRSSSSCHLTARHPPTHKVEPFSDWAVDTGCLLLCDSIML